jgi:coproporphyrinogen III oxidase
VNRLNTIEKWAVFVGVVFVVAGVSIIVHPKAIIVVPAKTLYTRYLGNNPEYYSKRRSQYTGGLAVLTGTVFIALALFRERA